MSRTIAVFASWFALAIAAFVAFVDLYDSGQLMFAVLHGVLVPAAIVGEWWWWRSHPDGDPSAVVLRMIPIVAIALLGIGVGGKCP